MLGHAHVVPARIRQLVTATRPPTRSTPHHVDPHAPATGVTASNVPSTLTPLVGRVPELAELTGLVRNERLVTLVGPGGCGKTRLAQELARRVAPDFVDGVIWVELAPRPDEPAVIAAVAGAVGVTDVGSHPLLDRAVASLTERTQVLVVLDNAEHVLTATARVAAVVLAEAPGVSVVCTSREPLGLRGEVAWPVPALSTPTPSRCADAGTDVFDLTALARSEAVQLFADRAARVRRGFRVDAANATAVARICVRLDGLPLAIELVAARMRSMPVERIAAQLHDRLQIVDLLGRGTATRHQSLQASISWSEELLDDEERKVFRRLGVFVGGFTVDAATAVVSGFDDLSQSVVAEHLGRLVDKSLVVFDDGRDRFTMLETVRAFALERLDEHGEQPRCRDAHATWFAGWLQNLDEVANANDAQRFIDGTVGWLRTVEPDEANCHAALDWADDGSGVSLRLVAGLSYYWLLSAHFDEAARYGLAALLAGDPSTPEWGEAAGWLGGVLRAADTEQWARLQRASRGASTPRSARLRVRLDGALMSTEIATHGLTLEELERFRATRDEAERLGDWYTYTNCVYIPASVLMECGRLREAAALLGTFFNHRTVLVEAGCAIWRGELHTAGALIEFAAESVANHLRDLPTERFEVAHHALWVQLLRGTPLGPLARVSRVPGRNLGTFDDVRGYIDACTPIAGGDMVTAARRLEAFNAVAPLAVRGHAQLRLAQVQLSLGEVAAARTSTETMSREWVDIEAPAHDSIGLLVLAECDRAEGLPSAGERAHRALAIAAEHELWILAVDALEAIGSMLVDGARSGDGARLLAAAEAERERMGYVHRYPHRAAYVDSARSRVEPSAEWTEGRMLALPTAVALARRMRGERTRPSTGWASLTPTERSVVDAVVAGLTNPEIAAQLFMSRATVKTHLNHVYAKLGLPTRAALAAAAARRAPGDRSG